MSNVFVIIDEWYDEDADRDLVELPNTYYTSFFSALDELRDLAADHGVELGRTSSSFVHPDNEFETFYILELEKGD